MSWGGNSVEKHSIFYFPFLNDMLSCCSMGDAQEDVGASSQAWEMFRSCETIMEEAWDFAFNLILNP